MRIGANYAVHDSFTLTLTTPARGTLLLYRGMCNGAGQSCEREDACERTRMGCRNRIISIAEGR